MSLQHEMHHNLQTPHTLLDHDLKACAEFANYGAARVVETFGPRLTRDGYQETLKSFQKS